MTRNLLIALTSLLLVACQPDVVYTDFNTLPDNGWEADSAIGFHPTITDTTSNYQFQIIVRHTDAYQYQNLWMFVDILKDSLLLTTDTIECYLANQRGEWLGGGLSIHELPLMYDDKYRFFTSGTYHISIRQGMRTDTLEGLKEIGVKFIQNGQE